MKLIVKADDYGYTKTYNDGTIDAIENGIVTIVDLMMDTPGVEDAIARIKSYPWVSVGWHGSHLWGAPVADPSLVPSMYDADTGRFIDWRKHPDAKDKIVYEEALIEARAQIEKCVKLLGHAPEIARIRDDSPWEKAKKVICDEYGINYTYEQKIVRLTNGTPCYALAESKDYNKIKQYDPAKYIMSCESSVHNDDCAITVWHPGYLDAYIAAESSFTEVRCVDVSAMCDPDLKKWIVKNEIELVNMHDALADTNEYQNHLKVIGSDLCVHRYSN